MLVSLEFYKTSVLFAAARFKTSLFFFSSLVFEFVAIRNSNSVRILLFVKLT